MMEYTLGGNVEMRRGMEVETCKAAGPGVLIKPCNTVDINETMDTPIIQSKGSQETLNLDANLRSKCEALEKKNLRLQCENNKIKLEKLALEKRVKDAETLNQNYFFNYFLSPSQNENVIPSKNSVDDEAQSIMAIQLKDLNSLKRRYEIVIAEKESLLSEVVMLTQKYESIFESVYKSHPNTHLDILKGKTCSNARNSEATFKKNYEQLRNLFNIRNKEKQILLAKTSQLLLIVRNLENKFSSKLHKKGNQAKDVEMPNESLKNKEEMEQSAEMEVDKDIKDKDKVKSENGKKEELLDSNSNKDESPEPKVDKSNDMEESEPKESDEHVKEHEDSLHLGKTFPCTMCERIFPNHSSMNQHIKLLHSKGEKKSSFLCTFETCSKSFSTKQHLKSHICVHTGIKPYNCDKCSKSFSSKHQLKIHIHVHTGVKPYKCDSCQKTFATKQHLQTHKTIHSGIRSYKCDKCPKAFTRKQHLKTHKLIHSRNKPLNSCNISNFF